MKRKEFDKLSDECKYDLFVSLLATVEKLCQEISELKAQLNQSSANSSKPPSSDAWKPVKIPRIRTGASQGGQPGHKGNFLKFEREADEIVELKPKSCEKCGVELAPSVGPVLESRHKMDIEIRTKITKYDQYEVVCSCCGNANREEFPPDVKSHVSYGEGVQSIGVLLTNYANVSYGKTAKIMNDVLGVPISTGTLVNHVDEFAEKCEPVLTEIAENVKSGEVGHFDETGVRVEGKNQWLHTAGNSEATYNTVHSKRGHEGTDDNGVLKDFTGVAVHDCLKQYFGYTNARHALCNAHLLRELQGVIENTKQTWAAHMQTHLRDMKKAVDEFKADGKTALPDELLEHFSSEYGRIIKIGEAESPRIERQRKQSKSRNLLERFIAHEPEITRFSKEFNVPFDNNQAERDIRNTKVKMKVSGGFRSVGGAKHFAKISSVIGTATKQKLGAFKTVSDIFGGTLHSLFTKPVTAE